MFKQSRKYLQQTLYFADIKILLIFKLLIFSFSLLWQGSKYR